MMLVSYISSPNWPHINTLRTTTDSEIFFCLQSRLSSPEVLPLVAYVIECWQCRSLQRLKVRENVTNSSDMEDGWKKKEEVCLATMTIKFRVCKGVDRLAQGLCIAVDTDSSAVGETQTRNWHKDEWLSSVEMLVAGKTRVSCFLTSSLLRGTMRSQVADTLCAA
jgi:hypothetical protein